SIAAFADLLSASLATASDRYALVERAEITKLAAEAEIQKLAADQRPSALAKLAKADGLIIIGADKGDPKLPKLTLRLTSTNNGLVLRSLILGGKQDEYPKAAELAAGVLRFPCERLTRGDAKPPIIVSLLGIRPAFEIDRALETTLNLAIGQQLSAQSGIAVSERWKMNDLVFERSLADERPQAFATGTVLLDGSYTRKGDQLEFSLRLRKVESEEGKTFTLQGPANKPNDLAQQIAKLIAIENGQSGEAVAWNALEEGEQYTELGWWLVRRNLWEESIQAYESAIALGNELAVVQSTGAYENIVDSNAAYRIPRTEVDGWDHLPKEEFKRKLNYAIRLSYSALRVMQPQGGELLTKKHPRLNQSLAVSEFFLTNMKVLQALCLRSGQLELGTEARALRALSREIIARGKKVFGADFGDDLVQRAYMHETPEDAAADLRTLLEPAKCRSAKSATHSFRYQLWANRKDRLLWRMVDWSSTDNKRADHVMRELIAELSAAPALMNRVDGLALGFQESRSDEERVRILDAYFELLEARFEEFLTPGGQLVFENMPIADCLKMAPALRDDFEMRFAKVIIRIFETAEWLDESSIRVMRDSVNLWGTNQSNLSGRSMVPEACAVQLLDSAMRYIHRTDSDPRWNKYPDPAYVTYVRKMLAGIPDAILRTYPRIGEQRIMVRPVVPGAVPLRAWKPDFASELGGPAKMLGDFILWSGDSLLVACVDGNVLSIDVNRMTVKRSFQTPTREGEIAGMAIAGDSLMVNRGRELFVRSISGEQTQWKQVETPGVTPKAPLNWQITGLGDEFLVGSVMTGEEKSTPRMLVGKARDGRLTWLASSNRRPSINPLDEMDPRDVTLAYRNASGRTMVYFDSYDITPLVELETGRIVSSLPDMGKVQPKGDMPLYWKASLGESIETLVAFDPSQDQPLLLFKPHSGLPERWKDANPIHDRSRPEFLGPFVVPIVHDGKLWLLKREADIPGRSEKNGPNDFRLTCVPLRGGDPKVIPLQYDVPENLRKLGNDGNQNLERPVINPLSMTATPMGLFFAPAGIWYGAGVHRFDGLPSGGYSTPVLFYITWDDINAWLAKNAPESIKPASP
ncbi:MAG: hypothetical protein ABI600_17085, partial [Luteolibacter sp.]